MAESSTPGERQRAGSMEQPANISGPYRLVLVGKTGEGKSSCGNTILGRDVFKAAVSPSSVTSECTKQSGEVCDKQVAIVDTPGLFDTLLNEDTVKREISKCINMSAPGPHAILLVVKAGHFSAEDQKAVQKVEDVLGKNVWKYTIILFSHGDEVEGDFDEILKNESGDELKEILKKVDNRYHLFNNHKVNDRGQVLDLLKKVEKMVAANGGKVYSNPTYLEVVEMLKEREEKLRKFYQNKLDEEVKAVESKYKEKLKKLKKLKEAQDVEEEKECELKELKRYFHALVDGVRHVVEKIADSDPFENFLNEFHVNLKLI